MHAVLAQECTQCTYPIHHHFFAAGHAEEDCKQETGLTCMADIIIVPMLFWSWFSYDLMGGAARVCTAREELPLEL